MKIKSTLLALITFLCFTISDVDAQIKVVNNNVGIGTSSPGYKLQVNGSFKIDRGATDIIVDSRGQGGGGGEPTIRPSRKDYGFLGTSDRYFFKTYTRSIYRSNEFSLSDKKVKKDIQKIDSPLSKLALLNGYTYELDATKHPFISEKEAKKGERQMGFIAQELQEVFPDMVQFDEELGYLVVKNYEQMLPVLVEAIKEQQKQIEALRAAIGK